MPREAGFGCGRHEEVREAGFGRAREAPPRAAGRARRAARGFTLIEVLVALLVVALIASIGVKGFRAITKSDLRAATAHLSGAIRYLFDRASITGKYHRLVIDLTDGKYWAEV